VHGGCVADAYKGRFTPWKPPMPIELYNQDGHRCLMFTDLCQDGGEAVQSNQFLIVPKATSSSTTR
jgi:hypothetical protein